MTTNQGSTHLERTGVSMKRQAVLLFSFILITAAILRAQDRSPYVPETDPLVVKKLAAWQGLKFGLMMTWGPYSQWGVVESWSICAEDEPWCQRNAPDYVRYKQDYEGLKKTFNPVQFDPAKWARAAKDAGIRYVVGMAKHHDGFCMFDTRTTDYGVTDPGTPFSSHPKANILKEILTAFRAEGLWAGIYFSKPDWHSENYWWPYFPTPDRNVNYDIKKYPDRWKRFVGFTHTQIEELMTGYGPVDILWLDGGWVQPMTREEVLHYITAPDYKFSHIQSQDIYMPELARMARGHQPGLIVVDRAVHGKYQNYLTPENVVPDTLLPYPWESCITATTSWSYTFKDQYKSGRELIHMLVDIVAKGGNLLLNIGPGPDGTWQQEAYDRLAEVGAWMKVNSSAIYDTHPIAPYREGAVRLTQGKDGAVYAVMLAGKGETMPPETVRLSSLRPAAGARVSLLGSTATLAWKNTGKGCEITIPASVRTKAPCKEAWVVRISQVQ